MSLVIVFDAILLTALLIVGVPVPLCFAAACLFLFALGDIGSASFLIGAGFSKISSIIIVAIPLYILAGGLMSHGGIAGRLIDVADAALGRTKGGLGLVVIFTTAVFGAISGMASSAVAAIGTIMIPKMVDRGYDRAYAATLVSASSVLALLIPPSASMILFGWVTGTSITACFLAPVLPGILLIGLFGFWNRFYAARMEVTVAAPAKFTAIASDILAKTRRASLALLMPVLILGFIYGGITTPTEAAAIAVVYAVPVSLVIYRDLTLKEFWEVVWRSGQTAGVLLILVFFAAMLSRLFTLEKRAPAHPRGFHECDPASDWPASDGQRLPGSDRNVHGGCQRHPAGRTHAYAGHAAGGRRPGSVRRHRGGQSRNGPDHAADRADPLFRGAYRQDPTRVDAQADSGVHPLCLPAGRAADDLCAQPIPRSAPIFFLGG
ncbi:TRAP transporter large permease [Roseibium salinum]|nr:TRAP transporter large permease [Roseibium salinum]